MKRLFCVAACMAVITSGRAESSLNTNQPYPQRDIVCENLYQGNSIENAVAFAGSPENRRQEDIHYLSRQNGLAQDKALAFANRLFKTGQTRNSEDFTSLLSRKMKALLVEKDKQTTLNAHINRVRSGHAFSAPCEDDFYGNCGAKYIVTFGEVDKKRLEDSKWFYFPEKPTHQFCFLHFHKPGYTLTGEMWYAVEEEGDYKIVALSVTNEEAPEYQTPKRVLPVTISGIEEKTIFELGGSPNDQWHIGLTPEDNKNHIIEIVRTSHRIKGDRLLEDDEAETVVMDYDHVEKFANIWDDVRFKFRADFESAGKKFFGYGRSGLDYGFNIASQSKSGAFMYPGTEISNLKLKTEGVFEEGKLELFSFDSTAEDGTLYSNSVYVRLTPKQSSATLRAGSESSVAEKSAN